MISTLPITSLDTYHTNAFERKHRRAKIQRPRAVRFYERPIVKIWKALEDELKDDDQTNDLQHGGY